MTIENKKTRIAHDTMGEMHVPIDKFWGAQTARSTINFAIGKDKMPMEIIYAYAHIKKASAQANEKIGKLDTEISKYIVKACEEILEGKYDDNFPLSVWQTGSGTQTNMNINEVIANVAKIISGHDIESNYIHPNDHVNLSQSSNDTFPSAMSIASYTLAKKKLIPALEKFEQVLEEKINKFDNIIKIGRTHTQDATPLTVGQEFSGYLQQIKNTIDIVKNSTINLNQLAQGGTAVGTGINASNDFINYFIENINKNTGFDFITSPNKFEAISSSDNAVNFANSLSSVAVTLNKIANDLRLLSSGPRCGIVEYIIPENEPGSSIMPGKVNPTQIEALTMICCQVLGNTHAINLGGMNGQFQLNAYRPMMINNIIQSIHILSDGLQSFVKNCFIGIEIHHQNIEKNLNNSLMLVTCLTGLIGYDNSAKLAKHAHKNNISLRDANKELGFISDEDFIKNVKPENMI